MADEYLAVREGSAVVNHTLAVFQSEPDYVLGGGIYEDLLAQVEPEAASEGLLVRGEGDLEGAIGHLTLLTGAGDTEAAANVGVSLEELEAA